MIKAVYSLLLIGFLYSYGLSQEESTQKYSIGFKYHEDQDTLRVGFQLTPQIILFQNGHFEKNKPYKLYHLDPEMNSKGEGRLLMNIPNSKCSLLISKDFSESKNLLKMNINDLPAKGEDIYLVSNGKSLRRHNLDEDKVSFLKVRYEGKYFSRKEEEKELFAISTLEYDAGRLDQHHVNYWAALNKDFQLIGLIERKEFKPIVPFKDSLKRMYYVYRKIETTALYKNLNKKDEVSAISKKVSSSTRVDFATKFSHQLSHDKQKLYLYSHHKMLTIDTNTMKHSISSHGKELFFPTIICQTDADMVLTTKKNEIFRINKSNEKILASGKISHNFQDRKHAISNDFRSIALLNSLSDRKNSVYLSIVNLENCETIYEDKNIHHVLWLNKRNRFALISHKEIKFISKNGKADKTKITLKNKFTIGTSSRAYEAVNGIIIGKDIFSYKTGNLIGTLESKLYSRNQSGLGLIEIENSEDKTDLHLINAKNLNRSSKISLDKFIVKSFYDFRHAAKPFFIITHSDNELSLIPQDESNKFDQGKEISHVSQDSEDTNKSEVKLKSDYIRKQPEEVSYFELNKNWTFQLELADEDSTKVFIKSSGPKNLVVHKDGLIEFKSKSEFTFGGPCIIHLNDSNNKLLQEIKFSLQPKSFRVGIDSRGRISDAYYFKDYKTGVVTSTRENAIHIFNYPPENDDIIEIKTSLNLDRCLKYKKHLIAVNFANAQLTLIKPIGNEKLVNIKMADSIIRQAEIGPEGKIWMIIDRVDRNRNVFRALSISEIINNSKLSEKLYPLVHDSPSNRKEIRIKHKNINFRLFSSLPTPKDPSTIKGSKEKDTTVNVDFKPLTSTSFRLGFSLYQIKDKTAYQMLQGPNQNFFLDEKHKRLYVNYYGKRFILDYPALKLDRIGLEKEPFGYSKFEIINNEFIIQKNSSKAALISRDSGKFLQYLKNNGKEFKSLCLSENCFGFYNNNQLYFGAHSF